MQIARAFIAKAVLNLGTTNELIERLTLDSSLKRICGFPLNKRIPDKTVFSRAFAEFSLYGLPEKVHAALIKKHLSGAQFDSVSQDSTAIEAREKPIKFEARTDSENTPKRKRGRSKKDDAPLPEKELTVIERQQTQSFEEMLAKLPRYCNVGT